MSYYKQYDDENLENKNKQIAAVNETAAKNKQTITDNYNAQINEAETQYDDQYRINAVQKLINERQVAESMANAGLTNSGLNRTQQTAVQLSYANNKAQLDRQKQSAIDNLNREMNAYLTEVETSASSSIASIEDTYNQNRQSYVTAMQQADIEAETQRLKDEYDYKLKLIEKQQEAESKISQISYGSLASTSYGSNGNVIYTDTSGNSVTMRAGANPYTGEVNSDLLVDGVYDASRAFSNGYQPKYYQGKELNAVSGAEYMPTWRTDGKTQKIFSTDGGKTCYVWSGPANKYEKVEKVNGNWYLSSSIPNKSSFANWKISDFVNYLLSLDESERQSEYNLLCDIGAFEDFVTEKEVYKKMTGQG